MQDTFREEITDTFRFRHHAIPLPTILDADWIIEATRKLTSAMAGRQNAPQDKLETIQALRSILPREEPTPSNTVLPALTQRPPTPTVTHAEEPPIQMWNPHAQPPPTQKHLSCNTTHNQPAVIENDDDPDPHGFNQPAARQFTSNQLQEQAE